MAIYVVKFGASVLGRKPANRNDADRLLTVTHQIQDIRNKGHDIVAVVAAFQGETNKRIADIDSLNQSQNILSPDQLHARAGFIAQGEVEAAQILAFFLSAPMFDARRIPLRTTGCIDVADVAIASSGASLANYLRTHNDSGRIAVVTGFQGVAEYEGTEQTTLLGRGGSDTTAIALAAILRNEFKHNQHVLCHIERVDGGVRTADPKRIPAATTVLDRLSFDELQAISMAGGGQVLQPRALTLAKQHQIDFTMGPLDELINAAQSSKHLTHIGSALSGRAILGIACSPANDHNATVGIAIVGRNITAELIAEATVCLEQHGIAPATTGKKTITGVESGLEIATFDVPNMPAITNAMQAIHKRLVVLAAA